MNKIIAILLAFLLSVSTCQKKTDNIIERTMVAVEDTLTRAQLDSVFTVDEISFNIEEDWIASPVLTEDRKEYLYEYVFIKDMTDSTGIVYTLCSYQDTLYILNKRVVE